MSKPKLLVVDDEPEIREAIGFFAQKYFEIFEANDGSEALKTIAKVPIDLILSDFNMPKMDGLELLKVLAEADESIPMVFLTGRGSTELYRSTWGLGIYDYLEKPFKPDELICCLRGALDSKATLSSIRDSRKVSKKLFEELKIILGTKTYREFHDMCLVQGISASSKITWLIEEQIKRDKIGS